MKTVYIVKEPNYDHIDSIWNNLELADMRKKELNATPSLIRYIVYKIELNTIIKPH